MRSINQYIPLNRNSYNIRLNQAITPYGPGALVDFKDQTLMAASPYYWKSGITIHDERLESSLRVSEFRMPPASEQMEGIPFVRFPEWYFCPRCRKFQSLSQWEALFNIRGKDKEMKSPKCVACNVQLSPAAILTACEQGHIQDFPWIEWVHLKGNNKICRNPQLKIKVGSGALGLEGINVECTNCNCKQSLRSAFNKNIFKQLEQISEGHKGQFKCKGNMPWKGTVEECNLYPTTIQRGGLSVYFSKIESSIVIPPYSDKLNSAIENSNEYQSMLSMMTKASRKGNIDQFKKDYLDDFIEDIAFEIKEDKKSVERIINRKLKGRADSEENEDTRETYREEEYGALLGNIPKSSLDSQDFKIEIQDIKEYSIYGLKNVVLVKRLREVRALVGFTRLNPPDQTVMGVNQSQSGKSKLVNLKEKECDWYPAYEVRGEGIFIEFDKSKIQNWIDKSPEIVERVSKLNHRYNSNEWITQNIDRNISPKFILLHTFAHLLMRELSFECGYSLASLRERIYCNMQEEGIEMSGVLIYTADGDSEGSMGGLVEQGKCEKLSRTVQNALNRADWCSNDPTCITSSGQGRDSLNLAACYSCTLVPETSCEEFNGLLDRGLIVGTLDDENIGFFKE